MANKLFFHGHQYDDKGEAPCPIEGCEDGQVACKDASGKPAWWQGGHLFVRNDAKSKTDEQTMGWERKTRP
jgi:hypothetical protein